MTKYFCELKLLFEGLNLRQKVFTCLAFVCVLALLTVSSELVTVYAFTAIAIMIYREIRIRNNKKYKMQKALDNKRLIIERKPREDLFSDTRLKLEDTRNKINDFSKIESEDQFCVELKNKLLNDTSELDEKLADECLKINNLMPILDKITSLWASIEPRIGNGLIEVYFYRGDLEIEMYSDREKRNSKDCINVMFDDEDQSYYITSRNIYHGLKNKIYFGEEKSIHFSNINESIDYTIKSIADFCARN
jgi:hypothetical protein